MVAIGEHAGKKTVALITDMDIPLGFAIGNSLEIIEVVDTLHNKGPRDLTEVCLHLASNMLFLSGKGTLEECRKMSEEAIASGAAFQKLIEMVEAQGGDSSVLKDTNNFAKAPYERKVIASMEGYITHMNTEQCGISSLVLGAGREKKEDSIDYSAGIILNKKVGEYVNKGEILATLYTSKEESLAESERILLNAIKIEEKPIKLEPLIFARIEKDKVEKFV